MVITIAKIVLPKTHLILKGDSFFRLGVRSWIYAICCLVFLSKPSFAGQAFAFDADDPLEILYIDISDEHFKTIKTKRAEALKKDILLADSSDFVPAKLTFKGKKYKADIRLKGDWVDHMSKEKNWSFRIKVKKGKTILGMRKFSVQAPATRSYLGEWVFHHTLKSAGLIGLRYLFVNVVLNGKDWGEYAVEEHFDRLLIESNQHREGIILAFDEGPYWEEMVNWGEHRSAIATVHNVDTMEIKVFNKNRVAQNPGLQRQYEIALDLLEKWRSNAVPVSQTFDVDKWGLFFALSDLLGGGHALSETNLRFYYNPITKLLEPIGFDSQSGNRISDLAALPFIDRRRGFVLYEKYLNALERVSSPAYVEEFFKRIRRPLDYIKEKSRLNFQEEIIYENAKIIRNLINPTKGLKVVFSGYMEGALRFKMKNFLKFPIQVDSIELAGQALIMPKDQVLVPQRINEGNKDYAPDYYEFRLPSGFKWSDAMKTELEISYKMLGSSRSLRESIIVQNFPDKMLIKNFFQSDLQDYSHFKFLTIDQSEKKIVISPGKWKMNQNLIIPEGFLVLCGPGTDIDLGNGAKIISLSPMHFVGSTIDPIIIHSTDSTGQGLILSGPKSPSYFRDVNFENLADPEEGGWMHKGAVLIYDSNAEFLNVKFAKNRGGIALNIVGSRFLLNQVVFEKNKHDSANIRLSSGQINSTAFIKSGQDALTFVSSEANLQGVNIQEAGGKGLAIKDHSLINAWSGNGLTIRDVHTAVSCTDLSQSTLQVISVQNAIIGFESVKEKTGYEPCKLDAGHGHLDISQTKIKFLPGKNAYVLIAGGLKNINTEESDGRTPLIQAINAKDIGAVKKILGEGADPNQQTNPSLIKGVNSGSLAIVRALLERGAVSGISPNALLDFKIKISEADFPAARKIFLEGAPKGKAVQYSRH